MRTLIKISTFFIVSLFSVSMKAQDPDFAQFFSSPLNINPALTANINSDWRIISNFRDQWIGPASPFVTGTISYDQKLFQKKMMDVAEGNRFGFGTMLMYDRAMAGVAKNTYASLNLSYNVKLSEGDVVNRIGTGFGAIYGRKYVDFEKLDFEEQFIGDGFNTNLPTGEEALSNMKAYISLTGGLCYSRTTEKSNIDLGVAAFHVNNPKQTFLEDENQTIAMRKVAHANLELYLNKSVILNVNSTYQEQSDASYYSIGGALGYQITTYPNVIFNAGAWYWSKNAITPYLGLNYNDFQFGVSYDATVSKLTEAPRRANSFEFSVILRGIKKFTREGKIPCPWK
jgi:type IX secretion system PorP/SprF family membrane protein